MDPELHYMSIDSCIPYYNNLCNNNNNTPSTLSSQSETEVYNSSSMILNHGLINGTIFPTVVHDHPERGIAGFVSKLYQCLQDNEHNYARWCKHNGIDMFIIDCIPEFTEIVLPKLFKHCKFASFVRQLNIYGFQRDTDARKSKDGRDRDSCRWYHPYFKPGRRDLFHLIRRKPPRYSRGKRRRPENDVDTVLNVSEDEVLINNENERRNSVSSVSSSSVTLHSTAPQQISREGSQDTRLPQDLFMSSSSSSILTPTSTIQPELYYTYTKPGYDLALYNQSLLQEEYEIYPIYLQQDYVQMYDTLATNHNNNNTYGLFQTQHINLLESPYPPYPSAIENNLTTHLSVESSRLTPQLTDMMNPVTPLCTLEHYPYFTTTNNNNSMPMPSQNYSNPSMYSSPSFEKTNDFLLL